MAEVGGSSLVATDEFVEGAVGSGSNSLCAKIGILGQNVSLRRRT